MTDDSTTTAHTTDQRTAGDRYLAPGRLTRTVMNPFVAGLVRLGFSVKGACELHVRGRRSGEWRTTPVNLLELDGRTYLVAPRGHTQWVRNLRAAGEGRLRRRRRIRDFTATELADEAKPEIIREYLRLWAFEVGAFFDGLTADSDDAEIAAVAPGFPVFEIHLR
jgi:deazaflavin-dependent oxidoreductase (nitroreductase family)